METLLVVFGIVVWFVLAIVYVRTSFYRECGKWAKASSDDSPFVIKWSSDVPPEEPPMPTKPDTSRLEDRV